MVTAFNSNNTINYQLLLYEYASSSLVCDWERTEEHDQLNNVHYAYPTCWYPET